MANVARPFGLKPVRYLSGAPYNGAAIRCYVSSSYATALFVGDLVDMDTTLANKDPSGLCQSIILSGAGTYADAVASLGVIVGFEPNYTGDMAKPYIPASTGGYALVCVDPMVVYQVQDDGAGTPTSVYIGQNCTFTYASGNTATGVGKSVLDTSTPAADSSMQALIIGLADLPNNELGDYAIWEVVLNKLRLQPIEAAAGDTGLIGVTAS